MAGSGGRLADLVVGEVAGEGVAGVCRAGGRWDGMARVVARPISGFRHEMVSDRGAPLIDVTDRATIRACIHRCRIVWLLYVMAR